MERTSKKKRYCGSCKISIVTTALVPYYMKKEETRVKNRTTFFYTACVRYCPSFFFIRYICVMFAMHVMSKRKKEKRKRGRERDKEREKPVGEYSDCLEKN